MKYVAINSVPNLSTGTVMWQMAEERMELGDECWVMWGRGRRACNVHEFNFGNPIALYLDVLQTRLDGKAGFHSKTITRRLLRKLDQIGPDVVHLHNIHGYYVNVEMLFRWLASHEEVKVYWTLHDCWAFTGRCSHFTCVGCEQWKGACAHHEECPQLDGYPKTYSGSASVNWCYLKKRECFNLLDKGRLTLVSPSRWLAGLVSQSFLSKYRVEVRPNVVNRSVFKPTAGDLRTRLRIGGRVMILGVASIWSEHKGFDDFCRLAADLDGERFAIVVVGRGVRRAPKSAGRIKTIGWIESPHELARVYSSADYLFNPTTADTYPTVNLESEACGTPVVTYDTGGCAETVRLPGSKVVEGYDEALAFFRAVAG